MTAVFRLAVEADVPAVVALLGDDFLGKGREVEDMSRYVDTFRSMQAGSGNRVFVGDQAGGVVATYHLIVIEGLSLSAKRRAEIEAVRVATHLRGQGIGRQLMEDAVARARAAGCGLVQLTTNQTRHDAHRFYEGLGFERSHFGFKMRL